MTSRLLPLIAAALVASASQPSAQGAPGGGPPGGAPPKPGTLPTLSLPAKPAAPQAVGGPAAPAAATPAAQSLSWDGRWSGSFGARADIVVTISGGRVVSVSLLGQPLAVTSSSLGGDTGSISGPDFSLTMSRVAPGSAQGAYLNNRKEKASALLSRN